MLRLCQSHLFSRENLSLYIRCIYCCVPSSASGTWNRAQMNQTARMRRLRRWHGRCSALCAPLLDGVLYLTVSS